MSKASINSTAPYLMTKYGNRNKVTSCQSIHHGVWWRRGNTFASQRYGPGSTPGCMWDVFHPSQPMPGGFPLGVFFHPQKGSKLFQLELSHKADLTCSG